jgi:hypothetical protein
LPIVIVIGGKPDATCAFAFMDASLAIPGAQA